MPGVGARPYAARVCTLTAFLAPLACGGSGGAPIDHREAGASLDGHVHREAGTDLDADRAPRKRDAAHEAADATGGPCPEIAAYNQEACTTLGQKCPAMAYSSACSASVSCVCDQPGVWTCAELVCPACNYDNNDCMGFPDGPPDAGAQPPRDGAATPTRDADSDAPIRDAAGAS
jgi:hypothetical protein